MTRWFQTFLIFTLGKWSNLTDAHIFQMGGEKPPTRLKLPYNKRVSEAKWIASPSTKGAVQSWLMAEVCIISVTPCAWSSNPVFWCRWINRFFGWPKKDTKVTQTQELVGRFFFSIFFLVGIEILPPFLLWKKNLNGKSGHSEFHGTMGLVGAILLPAQQLTWTVLQILKRAIS